jgi:hypothetical protein
MSDNMSDMRTGDVKLRQRQLDGSAVGVDAERDEHHVLLDVNAVDHQHAELERTEVSTEPLRHLSLYRRDEPTAHRAAAGPARRQVRRQRLQRAPVPPGRYTDERLLDRALMQRILGAERRP